MKKRYKNHTKNTEKTCIPQKIDILMVTEELNRNDTKYNFYFLILLHMSKLYMPTAAEYERTATEFFAIAADDPVTYHEISDNLFGIPPVPKVTG